MDDRFIDRVPATGKDGRIKIKNVVNSGNEITGILEHADDAVQLGTLLNAEVLNGLEKDLRTYVDQKCEKLKETSSPLYLPIDGGLMGGNIDMNVKNLEFLQSANSGLVWYNSSKQETDRIYAPVNTRTSLYYKRAGAGASAFVHTAPNNASKIGFYARTSAMKEDDIVSIWPSEFGLTEIKGLVAMPKKAGVAGYPPGLTVWSNTANNQWNVACDSHKCDGFYAIAWGI